VDEGDMEEEGKEMKKKGVDDRNKNVIFFLGSWFLCFFYDVIRNSKDRRANEIN
jgi:hypothetical protein